MTEAEPTTHGLLQQIEGLEARNRLLSQTIIRLATGGEWQHHERLTAEITRLQDLLKHEWSKS